MAIYICSDEDGVVKTVKTEREAINWIREQLANNWDQVEFVAQHDCFYAEICAKFDNVAEIDDETVIKMGEGLYYEFREAEPEDDDAFPCGCCECCEQKQEPVRKPEPKPERVYRIYKL